MEVLCTIFLTILWVGGFFTLGTFWLAYKPKRRKPPIEEKRIGG